MPTTVISDNTTGRDFTGTNDTRIASAVPTTNFGSATSFPVDSGSVGLLQFTGLSNITGPVTVSAANIQFCSANTGVTSTIVFTKFIRSWTEAGVTWNTYDGSNSWGTAGGSNTSSDIASSSSGSLLVTSGATSSTYATWTCSAGMIADIEDWINNPGNNYGWRMTSADGLDITSSEGTDATRPILTVTYTSGGSGTTTAWIRA